MNGPRGPSENDPYEPELSAYLDGELPEAERSRVEGHLRACPRCAAELRALQRVGNALRRWDAHETRYAPSHGFRNRVLSRLGLSQETSAESGAESRPAVRRPASLVGAAGLAAAAAVLAAVATWASVRPADHGGDGAAIASLEREVARIRASVEGLALDRSGAGEPSGAPAGAPFSVPRIEAPSSVVAPPLRDPAAAAGPRVPDVWEVREDGTLLRAARPAWDEFHAERRFLSLEERTLQALAARPAAGSVTRAEAPPSPVSALLANATVSDVAFPSFEHVQVWPIELSTTQRGGLRPLTAEDAIARLALSVREDADGAVVATNTDTKGRPVLLLAGDVLKGPRRDRIVREEMIVPAGRTLVVPTFGSGTARKGATSYRTFTRSGLLAPLDVRALVGASLLGEPVSQEEVDEAVRTAVTAMGSNFGEGSLDNLWVNSELQREIGRTADAFRSRLDRPQVIGFAVAVGSRLVALELCGDAETFRIVRDRALRSHLLYAMSRPGEEKSGPTPEASAVTALLAAARRAVFDDPPDTAEPALSAFRTADSDVFGHGLVAGSRVVHAVVFAGAPEGGAAAAARPGRTGRARPGGSASPGTPGAGSGGPERGTDEGGRGLEQR